MVKTRMPLVFLPFCFQDLSFKLTKKTTEEFLIDNRITCYLRAKTVLRRFYPNGYRIELNRERKAEKDVADAFLKKYVAELYGPLRLYSFLSENEKVFKLENYNPKALVWKRHVDEISKNHDQFWFTLKKRTCEITANRQACKNSFEVFEKF